MEKKEHKFIIGGNEIVMKTCPRKSIREVQDLLRVHTWAEKGRLEYLYPTDALPAYMGEAIEFIDNELARKMNDA